MSRGGKLEKHIRIILKLEIELSAILVTHRLERLRSHRDLINHQPWGFAVNARVVAQLQRIKTLQECISASGGDVAELQPVFV